MIRKSFTATQRQVEDADQGIYSALITAETPDRDEDIVRAAGGQLENFMRNPVVLYGHDYRTPAGVVGRAIDLKVLPDKGIQGRWQFASADVSEHAAQVHRLWANKFLNAVSIGFMPLEWERRMDDEGEPMGGFFGAFDFTKWDLLEFSIVTVPAHQDALRLSSVARNVWRASDLTSVTEIQQWKLMQAAEGGFWGKKLPVIASCMECGDDFQMAASVAAQIAAGVHKQTCASCYSQRWAGWKVSGAMTNADKEAVGFFGPVAGTKDTNDKVVVNSEDFDVAALADTTFRLITEDNAKIDTSGTLSTEALQKELKKVRREAAQRRVQLRKARDERDKARRELEAAQQNATDEDRLAEGLAELVSSIQGAINHD